MSVDGERRAEVVAPYGWVYWECGGDQGDRPVRTPAPTGGFDGPSQCDRTGAHYPQGARRIRKAAKPQRLRCVRPYRCMTNATESTAAFAALRTAKQPASPGGKSSDAGRAAVGAYSKAKDGGTLSRYYLLCENHRRRVRSCAVNFRTGLPKQRRNLGFLGGANKGCAPLRGG